MLPRIDFDVRVELTGQYLFFFPGCQGYVCVLCSSLIGITVYSPIVGTVKNNHVNICADRIELSTFASAQHLPTKTLAKDTFFLKSFDNIKSRIINSISIIKI